MEDAGVFCDHLIHFMVIWYILWSFRTFYGRLVHYIAIWYILWPFWYRYFPSFGMLHQEKSGNPDRLRVRKSEHFLQIRTQGQPAKFSHATQPLRFIGNKKINMQTAGAKEKNVFVLSVALKRLRGKASPESRPG
jgi:hypothetical protein